ncbi:MAG: hypothetical protein Q9170_001165 [Blastenia crenularia]
MSSPSPSGFFSLPRELRDTIYHYYVFEPEGYHFEYESGKLRASGNRPIDLALMYTCSSIATEMHHLALGSNVLHFFTTPTTSETERKRAVRFDMFLSHLSSHRADLFSALMDPTLRQYKTLDVDAKVALRYPQLQPLLQEPYDLRFKHSRLAFKGCISSSWGVADSVFRAFQGYLLELLSADTNFPEALVNSYHTFLEPAGTDVPEDKRRELAQGRASFLRNVLFLPSPEPWMIPSEDELAQFYTSLGLNYPSPFRPLQTYLDHDDSPPPAGYGNHWKRVKWRFSAAATAIHFLKSLSQGICLGVKNVVLHEDRRSVAEPECHVLGFIPFCLQNPQLHVERRVNMWRVLLLGCWSDRRIHQHAERLVELSGFDNAERWNRYDKLLSPNFSKSCCSWITEASALFANGMPARSFSLVLDGDPAPDQSSEMFEILKEDAAWQVAQLQWYTDQSSRPGFTKPGFFSERYATFYLSDAFPQAINDIVEGNSFMSCNFPTGDLFDPKRVLDRNRHVTWDSSRPRDVACPGSKWLFEHTRYRLHKPIRLSPPLPSLVADLALEDLISEEPKDDAT